MRTNLEKTNHLRIRVRVNFLINKKKFLPQELLNAVGRFGVLLYYQLRLSKSVIVGYKVVKFFSLMEPKHKRSEIQTQVMNIIAILDFFVLHVIFYEIVQTLFPDLIIFLEFMFSKGQAKNKGVCDNYLPNSSTFFLF